MKLHLTNIEGRNTISGYGAGYVTVSRARYEHSLIVLPDRIIENWNASSDQALGAASIGTLATLGVEIVIIGTGETLRFPPPEALRPLIEASVAFEVMDTRAACRTFNILMAEGRSVAAALLL